MSRPFYHFTSTFYLPWILREGITRGDVPLSETVSTNGAWLTHEGRGHRQRYNRHSRIIIDGVEKVHNKAEIRLTIDPVLDALVLPWAEVVRRLLVDPAYASGLNQAGNESGDLWWICFRTIHPSEIVKVERDIRGNGEWREVTDLSEFPLLQFRSESSWERVTRRKITRIPVEEILSRLVG